MAKFVKFTNVTPPYEGLPIIINVEHVESVYNDLTAGNKVALWSKNNFWHVEEDFNTVMEMIGCDFREVPKKEEIN